MTSQPKDLNRCGTCGKEICPFGPRDSKDCEAFTNSCHGHPKDEEDTLMGRGEYYISQPTPKKEAKCEKRTYCYGAVCEATMETCLGYIKPHPADQTEKVEKHDTYFCGCGKRLCGKTNCGNGGYHHHD